MIKGITYTQLLIVATLVAASPCVALANNEGCSRRDSSRAALFISYEGIAEGSSEPDVRLRLHNNSDCQIIIETNDREPFVLRGEKNVALHYLSHDRRRQTLKPGHEWGDSVFTVEIRGGDSVWFRVPLAQFNRRLDVAVPFKFAWDGNHDGAGGVGGVTHYVYFLVDDIPSKNRRRK